MKLVIASFFAVFWDILVGTIELLERLRDWMRRFGRWPGLMLPLGFNL